MNAGIAKGEIVHVDASLIRAEVSWDSLVVRHVDAVGKARGYENLRAWFQILYQVLLGQDQGPRMGSFIALYGQPETLALIDKALAGEDLSAA